MLRRSRFDCPSAALSLKALVKQTQKVMLISLGMGLVATRITEVVEAMTEKENLGAFHGMVGVEAAVKNPAFSGDTLHVELEAFVDRKTSRGQTLVDLKHVVKNQNDQIVTVFTEKIIFDPPN